tara:strand:+ start:2045 stop:2743 length:699 start_codon:yes stop_codon:yes gene_type:complete
MIRALFLALALLLMSKHQLSAQTTQQTFDTSTLDAFLAIARTPVQSPGPSVQPVAPAINPPVGPPPVGPSGGSKTCDLRLAEVEDAVIALNDEFMDLKNQLGQLRPEVSRVQEMLRRPGTGDYCNAEWNESIKVLSGNLGDLAAADLRDKAKELMFCAISKNPELQQLKKEADAQDNQNELQKLALVESRLVDVDIRAGMLATETEALFREVGRYREGVANAENLCAPIDDF